MKLHDMRKERDHSASRWWIIVFSCVLKRVHHDGTAVLSGKGVKTVERNYRCWKSACELAVKYMFKTSELLPRSPSSCPLPRILSKITVWNIRFVSSAEISVQQEDPVIEGRRWTLESALPVGLHWTMGLSDPICWSEHPSAVFQKKNSCFYQPSAPLSGQSISRVHAHQFPVPWVRTSGLVSAVSRAPASRLSCAFCSVF